MPMFMDVHERLPHGATAEAPSVEAVVMVHRQAHGLLADRIYQVQDGA
jgi:hypothetical protein